jgi:hypothetical protein
MNLIGTPLGKGLIAEVKCPKCHYLNSINLEKTLRPYFEIPDDVELKLIDAKDPTSYIVY